MMLDKIPSIEEKGLAAMTGWPADPWLGIIQCC
jgi:hypothetical protein